MKTYSVKEASEILGIKVRAIQIRCKKEKVRKKNNKYLITEEIIKSWNEIKEDQTQKETQNANANRTQSDKMIVEEFTEAQYDELQRVIYDYPKLLESLQDHKNQIEYLRKSLDKAHDQMDILLNSIQKSIQAIQQGNYIIASKKDNNDN